MGRRRFTKAEKAALYLAADGRSELSGAPVSDHWHADHVVPYSKGGETTMANAQVLTPEENRAKGATALTRAWQQDFLKRYAAQDRATFLLAALPAAGKTRAALAVARGFLASPERRLIVVTPTLNIRDQWKDEGKKTFGIQLLTTKFAGHLNDAAFNGVVTTYQTVASSPLVFKRLCVKHRCLVIFDEVHHAGERASWGHGLLEAFEPADRRLALSGTPFRSDGEPIPFLSIGSDGFYQVDFSYDYPSAFREGVIRQLSFHRYGGSVTFQRDEDVCTVHTADDLSEDDTARRLRMLLGSRVYMHGFLKEAHDQLLEARRSKPNAGGLALCMNADHAVWIQSLLRELIGQEPDLIVSDGELATSTVAKFREDASRMWAVAVRQVSEGVDIRRLMVLAYATNWRTSLFFRQAVGRIMRYEGTDYDTEAYCFLPQDPELRLHAETIEAFQAEVIAEREVEEETGVGDPGTPRAATSFTLLASSDAEFDGLTNRGQHHDVERSSAIIGFAKRYGISETKAAEILQGEGLAGASREEPDNEAELARLAKQCNARANKLARARNCEPREIHAHWIKLTNAGHGKMTLLQFRQKLEWLEQQLRELGWM